MQIIDGLFDEHFHRLVIKELGQIMWAKASDPAPENKSDSGFVSCTYNDFEGNPPEPHKINLFAEIILDRLQQDIPELKDYSAVRFLWNYYTPSSSGTLHPDKLEDNFLSVIYNLEDSDGGTIIEDEFIPSQSGRAIIFKSAKLHKGVGPTKSLTRHVLNILLEKLDN